MYLTDVIGKHSYEAPYVASEDFLRLPFSGGIPSLSGRFCDLAFSGRVSWTCGS